MIVTLQLLLKLFKLSCKIFSLDLRLLIKHELRLIRSSFFNPWCLIFKSGHLNIIQLFFIFPNLLKNSLDLFAIPFNRVPNFIFSLWDQLNPLLHIVKLLLKHINRISNLLKLKDWLRVLQLRRLELDWNYFQRLGNICFHARDGLNQSIDSWLDLVSHFLKDIAYLQVSQSTWDFLTVSSGLFKFRVDDVVFLIEVQDFLG